MEKISILLEWIKNHLGQSILSALAIATALISFVRLIRGDYFLGFTILGMLFLVSLMGLFVYISFYTIDSPIFPGRRLYRYKNLRPYSLIGLGITLVTLFVLLTIKPSRDYVLVAFKGTSTPTPTMTITPTITVTPTSTSLPSATPTQEPSDVTMVVTVNEQSDCGMEIIKASTLDIAINNNSDRDIIITSLALIPEKVYAGRFAGELEVEKRYDVIVDQWWEMDWSNQAALLEPIFVTDIPENKYTVGKSEPPSRFQIDLGLSDPVNYLQGGIYLEINTDSGLVLRSELLDIAVCVTPDEAEVFQPDPVSSLAFSPNGDILASGSNGGRIILWDTNSEQTYARMVINQHRANPGEGMISPVNSLAFSPDGTLLASADGYNIVLWKANDQQYIGELNREEGQSNMPYETNAMEYSPDGRLIVSGGFDGILLIWDVVGQQILTTSTVGHSGSINSLAFSPSGDILASAGDDGRIIVWDTSNWQSIREFAHNLGYPVRSIAFDDDGSLLAAGDDTGEIVLINLLSNEISYLYDPSEYVMPAISALDINPGGSWIAFGSSSIIEVWDIGSRQAIVETIRVGEPGYDMVTCLAFSPDGKKLVYGSSGSSDVAFYDFP